MVLKHRVYGLNPKISAWIHKKRNFYKAKRPFVIRSVSLPVNISYLVLKPETFAPYFCHSEARETVHCTYSCYRCLTTGIFVSEPSHWYNKKLEVHRYNTCIKLCTQSFSSWELPLYYRRWENFVYNIIMIICEKHLLSTYSINDTQVPTHIRGLVAVILAVIKTIAPRHVS